MWPGVVGRREVIDCTSYVPLVGFRWVRAHAEADGRGAKTWFLAAEPSVFSGRGECREVHPLDDHPALFREFSQLDGTDRDTVVAFAGVRGLLGPPLVPRLGLSGTPDAGRRPERKLMGESIAEWSAAVIAMRRAVITLDLISTDDAAGLGRHFRVRGPVPEGRRPGPGRGRRGGPPAGLDLARSGSWVFDAAGDPRLRHDSLRDSELILGVAPDTPSAPIRSVAMSYLTGQINRYSASCSLTSAFDPASGSLVLKLVPKGLLIGLWVQLAWTIAGNRRHRQCRDCGSWFEIAKDEDGRTARRQFCDDACKVRDHRRRRDRAAALADKGRSPRQIAAELRTPVETILRWLGGTGRTGRAG